MSNSLTASLLEDVTVIADEAEREGRDIDEDALRAAVNRAVIGGVLTGFDMTEPSAILNGHDDPEAKRRREE